MKDIPSYYRYWGKAEKDGVDAIYVNEGGNSLNGILGKNDA